MRLKKRLEINIVASVLTAFIILLVFFLTLYHVKKVLDTSETSSLILTGALERVTLRNDYLRNNSERAREQWFAKAKEIDGILKSATREFQDAEDKKNIAEIIAVHESIVKDFSAIVETREKASQYIYSAELSREVEGRLVSQLNMRVYEEVLLARKLRESASANLFSVLKLAGGGILFVLLLVGAVTLINSWTMRRAIVDRVLKLRDGASLIGGGALDHTIDVKGDDEFTELSGAFNAMTAKLRGSYNDLESEVDARKQSEEHLRLFIEHAPAALAMFDREMRYLSVSRRWLKDYNLGERELRGLLHYEVFPEIPEHWKAIHRRALAGEVVRDDHDRFDRADGSVQWLRWETRPWYDAAGNVAGIVVFSEDITERERVQWERETSVEFLRLVNESRNTLELVRAATAFFQKRTGCEAVGIRLREEHDYPYYETLGFPAEFVQAENRLCSSDNDRQPILDGAVSPVLDCMCGNVICGRFDPSKPFFTERGNFWANSTTRLLAATTEKDRQAMTRNRCNGEGYESVALIGLTLGNERLGLLQLNDHRKDRFTLESLALWERLADYLAVALAKFRAEEELQKSEARLRRFYESGMVGVIYWNMKGAITEANDKFLEMVGYTRQEMMSGSIDWVSMTPPEYRYLDERSTAELKATGVNKIPFEKEYIRKDGTRIPIIVSGAMLDDAHFNGVALVLDITERRRAEVAQGRLAAVVKSAEDAIISKDLNGIIQTWNVGAENIFGYTAEEIIGRNISVLVPPGYTDEVPDILKRISQGEHIEHFETVRMRKDGTIIPVLLTFSPIKDVSGTIVGVSKIAHDITERIQAEKQILALNEQLQQQVDELDAANKELEGFTYTVAHDLRSPLRHMTGFAQLLEKRLYDHLDDKVRHYTDVISSEATRMGMLVDDLLDFTRMKDAARQVKKIGLNALVEQAIRDIGYEVKGRDILWDIDQLPEVYCDESMLKMVFVNLIANAVKFTRTRSQAKIQIGVNQERDEWIIFIKDNGVGFDMKYADKLFGVFQRLHHSDEFEGTGIGLANVRRIISRHGGRTWAEGFVGQGAAFYFTLPKIEEG